MMKKVLIIYATYGSGHKAIAKYINNYFVSNNPDLDIRLIDMIDYSKKLGRASKKISEKLMLKHPFIWSILFKWADHKYTSRFTNTVSLKWFNKEKLEKDIKDYNPDLTISTHFYGSRFIRDLNKKKHLNSKLITIITDYETHNLWLDYCSDNEFVVVPSKDAKRGLSKHIPKKVIKPFGIPIFPKDDDNSKKVEILNNLGFKDDKPTCVCFSGGGNGSTATLPFIKSILKANQKLNYIFISGNNKKAYAKISSYVEKYHIKNAKVYGFVDNVPELLIASDFVVTKPGGAQTTECLYFKKPMLFIKSSGGQENDNVSYFTKNGYARFFKTPLKISRYFKKLDKNINDLNKMHNNLDKADNTKAMKKLYSLAMELLKNVKAK